MEKVDSNSIDISTVYDWSCRLAAETAADYQHYIWTEPIKQVLSKLQLGKGQLIFVIGYQGLGKSRAMYQLSNTLRKKGQNVLRLKMSTTGKILDFLDQRISDLKPSLKKQKTKDERIEALRNAIANFDVILLDLPDYGHKDFRLMSRDMKEIQSLWNDIIWFQDLKASPKLNLVTFIQREMFDTRFHFLYGKGTIVELTPLSEKQLVDNYIARFHSTHPFTNDAVQMLVKLARGNVRRFKRYISLCIERCYAEDEAQDPKNQVLLDTDFVARSVTSNDLLRDMEREIEHIFPKSQDAKRYAMDLILLLSERGELNEIQITEYLAKKYNSNAEKVSAGDIHDTYMRVSRIIEKLETYHYLKERRGEGNSKLISLV